MPILDVFRRYPREVLTAMGARFAENVSYYIFTIVVVTYLTKSDAHKLPSSFVLNAVLIGAAVHLITIPIWGALSDRFGRRPIYLLGAVGVGVWAFVFIYLIDTESFGLTVLAIVGGLLFHGAMYGPQAAFLSELFGTKVRYSGVSVGYQLASIVAGGLAPIIGVWLYTQYGGYAVAVYVAVSALVSVLAVATYGETRRARPGRRPRRRRPPPPSTADRRRRPPRSCPRRPRRWQDRPRVGDRARAAPAARPGRSGRADRGAGRRAGRGRPVDRDRWPASWRCGSGPGSTPTSAARPSWPRWSRRPATWRRGPTRARVLDAIVRRARTLLGTDVAYLTLADPERGDTFMRATAGSVSARFQTLRLPTGAGLGGLVAQTRRPYWTADYPADERFRHTSDIDAAVGEEGLVAICGTPLLVDGQFVGVLFASNRSRRPFQHDEVALLGSLATLAAVSLVQTQRATETAAALAALSQAHTAIQQAAAAHDRFVGVVLGGGGVDDIAATLGELLGCWVAVLDADGQRLAVVRRRPRPPAGAGPAGRLPGGAPLGRDRADHRGRRDLGGGGDRGRAAAGHAGAGRPGRRSTTGRAGPWSGRPW